MATPPTLIAFASATSGSSAAASQTSATLTWSIGDVLVAYGISEGGGAGDTMTIANTGSGLSWSTVQTYSNASDTPQYSWSATATANSSGTVTITHTRTTDRLSIGVFQDRAPSGETIAVGNSKLGHGLTTSPQQVALTISSPDSMVLWACGDWAAGAVESRSPTDSSHSSSTPGPSALPAGAQVGTNYTWQIVELDDETTGSGSVNFGFSGSSTGPFTIIAIEVKVTGGASGPQFAPHRMPLGA